MPLKILSGFLYTALCCFLFSGSLWANSDGSAFTVGKITADPKQQYDRLHPLATYIADELNDFGYNSGAVLMTQDASAMVTALQEGKVDLVTTTLLEAIWLIESGAGELAAIKWKDGVSHYGSVLATMDTGEIDSIADLIGKNVTFEDPNSASGFFIPYLAITETFESLVELPADLSHSESRIEGNVTYQFAHSKKNMEDWILSGKSDVLAFSDLGWQEFAAEHSRNQQFKIIYSSALVPRAMEIVRKDLPEAEKKALIATLHMMHLDPTAAEALQDYHQTSRLTRPTPADEQLITEYIAHLDRVLPAIAD